MSLPAAKRLPALDWMRGLVMVLMTVDHASHVFNGAGIAPDSYFFGAVGQDLQPAGSPWAFLTRWVTHLCAPTFLFLAGASAALSVASQEARGVSRWSIDGRMLRRGLLLILAEVWMFGAWPAQAMQVLFAIGASFVALAFCRHLPTAWTVGAAALWIVGGEALAVELGLRPDPLGGQGAPPAWAALLMVPRMELLSEQPHWFGMAIHPVRLVNYPLAGWLAILLLGHGLGRWLVRQRSAADLGSRLGRGLLWAGLASLGAFFVLRLSSDYGNFWLERTDGSWLRWLQVSKYPPSLAFTLLELGLMALILAGLVRLAEGKPRAWLTPLLGSWGLLSVLGQCALPFYLVHAHLLRLAGYLGWGIAPMDPGPFGVGSAWLAAAACVLVLWPCGYLWREASARRRRAQTGGGPAVGRSSSDRR